MIVYLIFFLSGAAALVYEVLWVRYLSIVFGGSHLAVTTVLAVFMGGLALGSYGIGKRAGNYKNLLRLYGLLELGIAASALVFMALMRFYPALYVPLARIAEDSPVYLSFIRVAFAAVALIVPTMLMGGDPARSVQFHFGTCESTGQPFFLSLRIQYLGGSLRICRSRFLFTAPLFRQRKHDNSSPDQCSGRRSGHCFAGKGADYFRRCGRRRKNIA